MFAHRTHAAHRLTHVVCRNNWRELAQLIMPVVWRASVNRAIQWVLVAMSGRKSGHSILVGAAVHTSII